MRHPVLIPLVLLVAYIWLSGLGLRQRPDTTTNVLTPLQQQMREHISSCGATDDELATLQALTLGYRQDLSRELRAHFQAAGAMHVLAVSGMHTGILYAIIVWLLTLGGRYQPLYEDRVGTLLLSLTVIGLMTAYAFITGLAPSVVRSVIMLSVGQLAICLRRRPWGLNTLFVAALLILLFRPQELYALGFWLSFLAVAALITATPNLPDSGDWTSRYVAGLVSASLAAQLGTLPLCIYAFGQISNYFLLTNLMVVPLAAVIMFTTVAYCIVGWVPGLHVLLSDMLRAEAWMLNHSVAWVESLPGSVTTVHISAAQMVLLYVSIGCGIACFRHRWRLYWLIPATVAVAAFVYLQR